MVEGLEYYQNTKDLQDSTYNSYVGIMEAEKC